MAGMRKGRREKPCRWDLLELVTSHLASGFHAENMGGGRLLPAV